MRLRRIVIALHDPAHMQPTLADAAALAHFVQGELAGLLIEDEDVCQFASLPFAREIVRASGMPRALNSDTLERQLRVRAQRIRRAFQQLEADKRLRTSLRIVRGRRQAQAAAAELPADVFFLARRRRKPLAKPRREYPTSGPIAPLAVYYDRSGHADRALEVGAALQKSRLGPLLVLTEHHVDLRELSATLTESDFRLLRVESNEGPEELAIRYGCRLLVLPSRGEAGSRLIEKEIETTGLPIALVV